jgi:TetR/AcrR family transcriptional regulator, transcriptional repressor of bet genes
MAELSAERRERILQAMAQCVVEEGIQGASLRKVAKRANATTGMITHYYRSKNELIVEALRSAGGRFRASLSTAGVKPGVDRLRKRFEFRFQNRNDEVPSWKYFMEYWAASTRSDDLRRHHIEMSRAGTQSMREDVEGAIKDGKANPGMHADLAADITHALYYGLGILSTLDPENYSEARAIDIYNTAIERILGTEPAK